MYSYVYDSLSGGIVLTSSPTGFSKEPRPVYAPELDLYGFSKYWAYDPQAEIPYMWAESTAYWYHGEQIAKIKGGDLYTAPVLQPTTQEDGNIPFSKETGQVLQPIDIPEMCRRNQELMEIVEDSTVKKIVREYEKFKNRVDLFHVAFSGGKDSIVLLELVKKALPRGSFVVIFGDTGMEFPDTYTVVDFVQKQCAEEGIPFYTAKSHLDPHESWNIFGPPARVLRWCCSVHKSAPQTLKMREITGKNDYTGMDFVGVRSHESLARSSYEYENYGKKQKGQYSFNPILEWASMEVWLYIFMNGLPINDAYKKGASRVGCLFCPMGGGKADYLQRAIYPDEVDPYIRIVKDMNARNAGNIEALNSYVSKGGWNARKNGRDLTNVSYNYLEEQVDNKFIITVTEPKTRWEEWIKTIGEIPFEYHIDYNENGYKVTCNLLEIKRNSRIFKLFRQVFKKASHCVCCRVCETNCRNGCISFQNGLTIMNCKHCGQCNEIADGCLMYHSVRPISRGTNMKKGSLNSFANHAPKPEWVQGFFDCGDDFWNSDNGLGKNQIPVFKRFLRECGLIDPKTGKTTYMFSIVSKMGWRDNTTWGLMLSNLAYNRQVNWYIDNMDCGVLYDRKYISDLLEEADVKKDDATSIINAFKRFCELPLGTVLRWGYVEQNGRQISNLCRTKCSIDDKRVFLYSLYLFAEKCNIEQELSVEYLFDENVERDGVSPVRLFGLYDQEELRSILLGLSSRYPAFINATYTNDLQSISLSEKSPVDVLQLLEEEI